VVVAIIALLMSILLPSLRAAREQARAVVCGQKLRDLGNGLGTYFAEHKEWIPGCNTSGVELRAVIGIPGAMNLGRRPVQSFDWMTPVLGRATAMAGQRAARFKELLTQFHCPSQQSYTASFYGPGLNQCMDRADFAADSRGWTACSYLMPIHFQAWGSRHHGEALAEHQANPAAAITVYTDPNGWETSNDPQYRSNLLQIGSPSQKVAAADGTRYVTESTLLDFDPNPNPTSFGAFTSSGAWWCGSTEYGVKQGSLNWSGRSVNGEEYPLARGRNLAMSYRHGIRPSVNDCTAQSNKGMINALFFDGSVRRMNDQQSRDPVLWYPKGASVNQGKAAEGMLDVLNAGDKIP
jgi:prepilin-type processing-associated H-X9-DG protein